MSHSSEQLPVKVYINACKARDKELIINENKGRTGIYRWVAKQHIESGKSYIGSSVFSVTRSYSTLNKKDSNSKPKVITKIPTPYAKQGFIPWCFSK